MSSPQEAPTDLCSSPACPCETPGAQTHCLTSLYGMPLMTQQGWHRPSGSCKGGLQTTLGYPAGQCSVAVTLV